MASKEGLVEVSFDSEVSFTTGYIPLDQLQKQLKTLAADNKEIHSIKFDYNGYCTDAVLRLIAGTLLKSPTAKLSTLAEINFTGCSLVTDVGLSWLAQHLQEKSGLLIKLDGCSKVTDAGLAGLKIAFPTSSISAMATSVVHLQHHAQTKGCPLLSVPTNFDHEERRKAQVLIIPYKTKVSTATYLSKRATEERKHLHYVQHASIVNWTLNLLEVDPQNPLYEHLVTPNLTQVIIPFDASCDPSDVKKHVADTISLVLSKETINPAHKSSEVTGSSDDNFFDKYNYHFCSLTDFGIFTSLSTTQNVLGMVVSRQPFSRTHPFFQVECLESEKKEDVGIVLGALYEPLFAERYPLESKEGSGGAVEGFELEPGAIFGFGVDGEWLSEYVPSDAAEYYWTINGVKISEKKSTESPHIGMYPMVSVMGKHQGRVRILNYNSPSEELLAEFEQKQQYWNYMFAYNALVDEHGVVSYCDTYSQQGQVGLVIMGQEITQKRNTCSIKILSTGNPGVITFGIGPENYNTNRHPGWDANSIALHGDNGELYKSVGHGEKPSSDCYIWKAGDVITITVTGFKGDMVTTDDSLNVQFTHNNRVVDTCTFVYKAELGVRCVFMIGMRCNGDKAQILNYRPLHLPQSPQRNMVTMGRSSYINPMDDGTLKYRKFKERSYYGLFISKTPFSKQLPYFEMHVVTCNSKQHLAIGACHMFYQHNSMLGWHQGSLAYHGDNGQLYLNSGSGTASPDGASAAYKTGDIVGCGIDFTQAKVNADGTIKPQQTLTVYFTKNGKKVHETQFEYLSEGLYPAVNMHYESDEIKLNNYYPGPESQKFGVKKIVKENTFGPDSKSVKFTEGCNFLVVGVSSDASDAKGKTQLVSQAFNPESDLSAIKCVREELDKLESNLGTLDLQMQERYSQLLWQWECQQRFINNSNRLSFMSLNTSTGEGIEDILRHVTRNLEMEFTMHTKFYEMQSLVWKYLDQVCSVLKDKQILMAEDLNSLVPNEIFAGNGKVCQQALYFLQKKGYLVCLPLKNSLVAMDMSLILTLTTNVAQKPTKQLQVTAPSIGDGATVWDDEIQIYPKAQGWDASRMRLLRWTMQFFGVMRIPHIRLSPTDPMYLFFTLNSLGSAPVEVKDFFSSAEDRRNMVVMQRTYRFVHILGSSLLAFILTRCARFSRAVLLRPDGGVFQSGAVQTLVQRKLEDKECILTLESQTYMPNVSGRALNHETRRYVEEYTWNIFCILADIIDVMLIKLNIPVIVHDNVPAGLVNVSIGCIHDWHSPVDEDNRQTICTLCNLCCEHGSKCSYKGIATQRLRQSGCGTKVTGCKDCGICKSCADELWTIRSFLRPCCEVASHKYAKNHTAVPLNSTTFDEVECTNFDIKMTPLCLKTDLPSESMIQVFPGPAVEIPNLDRLETYNKNKSFPRNMQFNQGDSIIVKLDPLKVSKAQMEEEVEQEVLEIKPVYYTIFCREARVWHDTGIVCYDSSSPSVPVAQFAGQKPLSPECNRFSFEIINPGKSCYIAIGLCPRRYNPNRQPGWDSGSIGYHADDGGIFLGAGWASAHKSLCKEGDVMAVEIDFEEQKARFFKNKELIVETNKLRVPAGGFYPIIGMHSVGEAVRLLEKEPWEQTKDEENDSLPDAFDCYKYGNMWISPGRTIQLATIQGMCTGWVMIHNPSRSLIGYQILPLSMNKSTGTLRGGESMTFYMSLPADNTPSHLTVQWLVLDSGREYTDEDINLLFQNATPESLLKHQLSLKVINTQLIDITELNKTSSGDPPSNVRYTMEIFKNGISVEKYWLKGGNYSCILPIASNAIMRYPKFPTLDIPNTLQKGMRLVSQPIKGVYAECVVRRISQAGEMITLEYSQPNSDDNTLKEVPLSSPVIQLDEIPYETIVRAKLPEKKEDAVDGNAPENKGDKPDEKNSETVVQAALEILGYLPRGNIAAAKRAYMFAPFHLLTVPSQNAIKALDRNWLRNSLQSVAVCKNNPTRLTVQEQQITAVSRKPSTWVHGNNGIKQRVGETFAYLPSSLDLNKLCYPRIPDMFQDVEVHRLCMLVDQLYVVGWQDSRIEVPIHFVDIPPTKPSQPLPDELMYGSMLSGWTYTSLVAKKLALPLCDHVFSGGKPNIPRLQLESAFKRLLQVYTSLCHIYAEQHGGLEYQLPFETGTDLIINAISHSDNHVRESVTMDLMKDPHLLFKLQFTVKPFTICKAHVICLESIRTLSFADNFQFHLEHFEPYEETINVIDRELRDLKLLPSDFFIRFPNLQIFVLNKCNMLSEIPPDISKCRFLEKLELKESAIKTLPADLFEVPELMEVKLMSLPLSSLPHKVIEYSWMTNLTLSGLQLTAVPPSLGNLTELIELSLDNNQLTDLPLELEKLQRLRILRLCGMPWITMEGNKSSIPLDKYQSWFDTHPYLQNHFGKEKLLKLFHDFDHNKNSMLDEEEISALNVHLFWDVPRLGSKDLNDNEYGGIPPVIFLLSALEELYLDFQAVTMVPVHMCRLQNLAFLSLAHNPLLENLPGSLGHLPSLKSIRLVSCPSLRTPPNEVISRGFESIKAYLKRLAGGFTECRRTKLMFVGLGGAGKTSLLRALMSVSKRTEGTKGEDITDGIVIQPWTVKSDESGVEVTYSTWDFAGQTLYYNTHQFFLSKRAVYLLLWSTRQGFEHAGLEFWLSSIASHAPKTPIFVIGTHCDQVPKADIPMADLKVRYPQIAGFHFVSSLTGTGIANLEKDLLKVTLEQKNMGEKIPQVWLNLEKKILSARTNTSILQWQVIKEYGMEVGIYDEKDIKEAIQFLHELGTVQYFDNDFLRDIIVINPQWIVNVMACVVSVRNSPIQEHKGRLYHKDIASIWNKYPAELHKWLLQLTEEFDLTFPLPKDNINIVPCLLPQEEPQELSWPSLDGHPGHRETKMTYKFAYLPAGLFNRAQVRLFQFSDGKLIWKRGSLLKKNRHLAIIKQISDSELLVRVQGPRPENIIFLVHEVIESLIEESFHGVVYDFLLPCPDCVLKEGTLDPSLFKGSLVKRAKDHRAPFLQCRKYFHTISMAQLQETMPADSAQDFDAHLQHSIAALQNLNSAMAKDVAILYSSWDIPANADTSSIHPAKIRNDLEKDGEKDGFSVWFPENVENVSVEATMMALKNCKLVVALVSDNFERDQKCNDLFLYTMDTLKKQYVIVVIRPSLNWMNTDLGMRIGKQEIMVMIKTEDRYKSKIGELLSSVKEKLSGIRSTLAQHPVCFISYCWSNSLDAQKKGTICPPGALGFVDPRDIKKYLEQHGISCWLDIEQAATGTGLFSNITQGMRQSRILIACVSDEYVKSDNCMMELRFGVLNLNLPMVVCVVGTGREWKESEVGILMHRSKADKVYFQQESPSAFETLLTYVKKKLPHESDQIFQKEIVKKQIEEIQQGKQQKPDHTTFREEYELTQRKFMRHIISYVSSTDSTPMPRLLVVDFEKPALVSRSSKMTPHSEQGGGSDSLRPKTSSQRPTIRPKTSSRTRDKMEPVVLDDEENWEAENFCLKLLCEHEEGWHLCETSFPVKLDEDFMLTMKRCSVYLARLFAILQQSFMQLHCFSGPRGKKFREWIEESAMENPNFIEAFGALRTQLYMNYNADKFLQQLCRCHLPSGKTYWLCEKHQEGPRITRLTTESASRDEVRRVLFEEDVRLKELLEKSKVYKEKKSQASKTKHITLPEKVNIDFNKKLPSAEVTQNGLPHVSSKNSLNASHEADIIKESGKPPNKDSVPKSKDKPAVSPVPSSSQSDTQKVKKSRACTLQ